MQSLHSLARKGMALDALFMGHKTKWLPAEVREVDEVNRRVLVRFAGDDEIDSDYDEWINLDDPNCCRVAPRASKARFPYDTPRRDSASSIAARAAKVAATTSSKRSPLQPISVASSANQSLLRSALARSPALKALIKKTTPRSTVPSVLSVDAHEMLDTPAGASFVPPREVATEAKASVEGVLSPTPAKPPRTLRWNPALTSTEHDDTDDTDDEGAMAAGALVLSPVVVGDIAAAPLSGRKLSRFSMTPRTVRVQTEAYVDEAMSECRNEFREKVEQVNGRVDHGLAAIRKIKREVLSVVEERAAAVIESTKELERTAAAAVAKHAEAIASSAPAAAAVEPALDIVSLRAEMTRSITAQVLANIARTAEAASKPAYKRAVPGSPMYKRVEAEVRRAIRNSPLLLVPPHVAAQRLAAAQRGGRALFAADVQRSRSGDGGGVVEAAAAAPSVRAFEAAPAKEVAEVAPTTPTRTEPRATPRSKARTPARVAFDRATAPLKAQPRRSLLLAALIAVIAISAMLMGQLEEPLAAADGAAGGTSASRAFQGGATVASAAAAQRSDEAAAATAAAKVGHFAVLPPRHGASFDAATGTSTVRLWMSDDVVRAAFCFCFCFCFRLCIRFLLVR